MNIEQARTYLEEHPAWDGTTVALAFREIDDLFITVDRLKGRFAGLNSYAGDALETGRTRKLDDAIEVLQLELLRLVRYWSEPLDEEKAAAPAIARADRDLRQRIEAIGDPKLRRELLEML